MYAGHITFQRRLPVSGLWLVASVLPIIPPYLIYLINQRIVDAKREDIEGLLMRPGVYEAYARAFGLGLRLRITYPEKEEQIKRLFARYYRLSIFLAPLIIVAGITWVATLAALSHVAELYPLPQEMTNLLKKVPVTCLDGFAGGYVWALFQVVLRYRNRDFTPSFAQSLWIGLVTSSLTAGFVGALGGFWASPLLDYAIGFLPSLEIVNWLQSYARRGLGAKIEELPSEAPTLNHLEGVTQNIAVRLAEEGIDSAHQLAYADPFLLLLRTNLPWVIILDLIDQALLFNYLEVRMRLLGPAGIRGAVEFARVFDDLTSADYLLDSLSKKIDTDVVLIRNLIQTFHEDYQVKLVSLLFASAFGEA
jgi:hypothetical protein